MSGVDYNEEETLLDGAPTPVAQVLIGAWSTGELRYINALDHYAVEASDSYISTTLVHLRKIYNIKKFIGDPTSDGNMLDHKLSDTDLAERFRSLNPDKQKALLRDSIARLTEEEDRKGQHLFNRKGDWIPVSLVLKHRLKQRLTNDTFYNYALDITPTGLPGQLRISKSTMSNASSLGLPGGRYYEWTDRQLAQNNSAKHVHMVCCRFWDIVKQRLYEIS